MCIAILLGVFWGLLEATFGSFLHFVRLGPVSGYIMGSIGMSILYWGWRKKIKYHHFFIIGLMAASIKLSGAFFFSIALFAPQIIRPAISILTQSIAFIFVASVMNVPNGLSNKINVFVPVELKTVNFARCLIGAMIITLAIVY